MALEPLSGWERFVAATILSFLRRYEEALVPAREAVDLNPHHGPSLIMLAAVLRDLGQFDEAILISEQGLKLTARTPLALVNAAVTHAKHGDRPRAERCASELVTRSASEWVSPYYVAQALGWVGQREEAFAWLERAVDAHDFWLVVLGVDRFADPLRDDPRFDEVMRRIGVPGS